MRVITRCIAVCAHVFHLSPAARMSLACLATQRFIVPASKDDELQLQPALVDHDTLMAHFTPLLHHLAAVPPPPPPPSDGQLLPLGAMPAVQELTRVHVAAVDASVALVQATAVELLDVLPASLQSERAKQLRWRHMRQRARLLELVRSPFLSTALAVDPIQMDAAASNGKVRVCVRM